MNKADKIRLNLRWVSETEEKIKVLNTEIAVYLKEINMYRGTIMKLEGEEE